MNKKLLKRKAAIHRKRKNRIIRFCTLSIFFSIIAFGSFQIGTKFIENSNIGLTLHQAPPSPTNPPSSAASQSTPFQTTALPAEPQQTDALLSDRAKSDPLLPDESLYSTNAILLSLSDNMILLDKNSSQEIYPASLTKMMTAILAIESLPDLEKEITLSAELFSDLYEQNASMAGFLPNEKVPAIDLIYGALLPSGAECTQGLACHIAGSEKAFAALMNEKAEELGMQNTHFTNSTGLHSENHYTTVKDIAILLSYCLQNELFKTAFTSVSHNTASTNLHKNGISFSSTMFKKMANPSFEGGEILGGKTGYTNEAGLCLASLTSLKGKEYILVTAGALGDPYSEQTNITDAFTVYGRLQLPPD